MPTNKKAKPMVIESAEREEAVKIVMGIRDITKNSHFKHGAIFIALYTSKIQTNRLKNRPRKLNKIGDKHGNSRI